LEKLGYTAVERQRLAIDRDNDQGASLLQEIAHSLSGKALRVDTTVIKDAGNPAAVGAPAATPAKTAPTPPPSGNGAV
jgi:hypothetical protein